MKPKEWKDGKADSAWKVFVCAQEYIRSDDLLSSLIYTLTDAGMNKEAGIAQIREMSGADIINCILNRRNSALRSVEKAYPEKADEVLG